MDMDLGSCNKNVVHAHLLYAYMMYQYCSVVGTIMIRWNMCLLMIIMNMIMIKSNMCLLMSIICSMNLYDKIFKRGRYFEIFLKLYKFAWKIVFLVKKLKQVVLKHCSYKSNRIENPSFISSIFNFYSCDMLPRKEYQRHIHQILECIQELDTYLSILSGFVSFIKVFMLWAYAWMQRGQPLTG